jgi:hypothetical protein
MPVSVKVNLDLRPLVNNPASPVRRHMALAGAAVKGVAQRGAPVDNGRLRPATSNREILAYPEIRQRISSHTRYAWWVNTGTGIYGPRRRMIRPRKKGGLLRWVGKDGTVRYARKVKGMRPRRYLVDAVKAVIGKTPRRKGGGGE